MSTKLLLLNIKSFVLEILKFNCFLDFFVYFVFFFAVEPKNIYINRISKKYFFYDLEQSYLGSDLVLNHPSGVSSLSFQVATFQKRATFPSIPTAQQVPDRRPPRCTSDP
jgi:hypothetical protein